MLIPTCLVKFFELILAVACLTLHHYSYDLTDIPTLILCSGTYVGYVIILSGEIIGEIMFAPLDLVQDMYFGILGMALFSVCGGLVLAARLHKAPYPRTGDHTAAIAAASLAIANAVIIFFDLSELVSAGADAFVDACWSSVGGALFGACGSLTLHAWRDVPDSTRKSHARALAVCSFAAAALLAVDAVFALCATRREDDDDSSRPRSRKP